MRELLLRQHIEHIALVLAFVERLFEQISSRAVVLLDSRVMSRNDYICAALLGGTEQLVEFHMAVAVDAGIGRAAAFIGADKFFDDFVLEVLSVIQNRIGNIQRKSDLARVLDILLGAAGPMTAAADILAMEEPHGDALAVITAAFHKISGDRAVNAAAHGNQCFHR